MTELTKEWERNLRAFLHEIKSVSSIRLEDDPRLKKMVEVETLIKQLAEHNCLTSEIAREVILVYRTLFFDKVNKNLSFIVVKCFQTLLEIDPQNAMQMRKLKVHIVLAALLERGSKMEMHFMEFVRCWSRKSPNTFPMICGFSLSFLSSSENDHKKSRIWSINCLKTLLLENAKLLSEIDGFKSIFDAMLDPSLQKENAIKKLTPNVMLAMDSEASRTMLIKNSGLSKLFALFTDIKADNVFAAEYKFESRKEIPESRLKALFKERLLIARRKLSKILNSFGGMLFLSQQSGLAEAFIGALRQPINDDAKLTLLELIEDLLTSAANERASKNYSLLMLALMIETKLHAMLIELCMIPNFEEKAKEVLTLLIGFFFKSVPQSSIPNTDYLIYSLEDSNNGIKESIIRSKIRGILDMAAKVSIVARLPEIKQDNERRNGFLYQLEKFYLSQPSCFRDANIQSNDIWTQVTPPQGTDESPLLLLDQLSQNFQKWDLNKMNALIELFKKDEGLLIKHLPQNFFKLLLCFMQFREQSFFYVEWKPENFKLVEVIYNFFELILSFQSSAILLRRKIFENWFVTYQPFGQTLVEVLSLYRPFIRNNLAPHRKTSESMINNDQDTTTYLKYLDHLKARNFQQTMFREFFLLVANFTHFKYGGDFFSKYNLFKHLKELIRQNGRYDVLINPISLCFNYKDDLNARDFLKVLLSAGSDIMIKVALNIVYFLLNSEFYKVVENDFSAAIIANLSGPFGVGRLAALCIQDLVLSCDCEEKLLPEISEDLFDQHRDILFAFLKKEVTAEIICKKPLIEQLVNEFWTKDFSALYFSQTTMLFDDLDVCAPVVEHRFTYTHSNSVLQNRLNDSGKYIIGLMKYPWSIEVRYVIDERKLDSISPFTEPYYDPIKSAIILSIPSAETSSGLLFSQSLLPLTPFVISVALFIGGFQVNYFLEPVQNDFSAEIMVDPSELKVSKEYSKWEKAESHGIKLYFLRQTNGLILMNIKVSIIIENPHIHNFRKNETLIDALCSTNAGTNYLFDSNESFLKNILNEDSRYDPQQNQQLYIDYLLTLGSIGRHELAAKRLIDLIGGYLKNIFHKEYQSQGGYLSVKGAIFQVANMFANTKSGRDLLRKCEWQVDAVCSHLNCLSDTYTSLPHFQPKIGTVIEEDFSKSPKWEIYASHINIKTNSKATTDKELLSDFIMDVFKDRRNSFKVKLSNFIIKKTDDPFFQDLESFYVIIFHLSFFPIKGYFRAGLWELVEKFFAAENFWKNWDSLDEQYTQFLELI